MDEKLLQKELKKIKPQIIIHAARIAPDDDNPERAKMVTNQLVKTVKSINTKLIYISSDAIFDGKNGNYKETDKPNPITGYGKAKLATENIIRKNLKNYIIIRTSHIYGKSFGKWDKRISELIKQVKSGQVVYRYQDMYRSPILVNDLAKACWQLIEKDFSGVINVAGKRKSIYNFSRVIIRSLKLNTRLITASYLKDSKITPDTSLNTELAQKVINFKPK